MSSTEAARVLRVLVVDDHREMADTIADDLSGRGYDPIATSSGRDALQRLRTERFDVLVSDIGMPGVSGLELLRASLRLDPSRPVILMTAYTTLATVMSAMGDGAYHTLSKPFRLDTLSRLIREALRRRGEGGERVAEGTPLAHEPEGR